MSGVHPMFVGEYRWRPSQSFIQKPDFISSWLAKLGFGGHPSDSCNIKLFTLEINLLKLRWCYTIQVWLCIEFTKFLCVPPRNIRPHQQIKLLYTYFDGSLLAPLQSRWQSLVEYRHWHIKSFGRLLLGTNGCLIIVCVY